GDARSTEISDRMMPTSSTARAAAMKRSPLSPPSMVGAGAGAGGGTGAIGGAVVGSRDVVVVRFIRNTVPTSGSPDAAGPGGGWIAGAEPGSDAPPCAGGEPTK